MPCGHEISRDALTSFMRQLINSQANSIKCYQLSRYGFKCGVEWNWVTCKKIGVLTFEEISAF